MRKFCKIIIYTLDFHHSLMIIIDCKSLIFYGFCCNIYLRQKTNLSKNRIICRCSLSSTGTTLSCGSKLVKSEATRSWKPLKTLRTMTRAIVATATPITEIELMTLMTCVLFFEKRYLRAIKNGKFIILSYLIYITV